MGSKISIFALEVAEFHRISTFSDAYIHLHTGYGRLPKIAGISAIPYPFLMRLGSF